MVCQKIPNYMLKNVVFAIKTRNPIYRARSPLERIHIGILGPPPVTKRGNKYILMIIDQFTK